MAKETIELLASGDHSFLAQERRGYLAKVSAKVGDVLLDSTGYRQTRRIQDENERASSGAEPDPQLSADRSNSGP
jgi:hypothetical protein